VNDYTNISRTRPIMKGAGVIAALASVGAACSGPSAPQVGEDQQAILGPGDPCLARPWLCMEFNVGRKMIHET
jgi:hypothetical protein